MTGTLIFGAGGHAKVISDVLMCQGILLRGFLDDSPSTWGHTVIGLPILGAISSWADYEPDGVIIGIGSNATRQQVVDRLHIPMAELWLNAIHPRAVISSHITVGHGVVIVAGAVINISANIGNHVIINTCASVDHDCVIGDYVHIAPGAHLTGGVIVKEGALVGAGASIIPGCTIGKWSTIAAGSVVIDDIPDGVVAKGIPARW